MGFTPHNKPAETLLQKYYAASKSGLGLKKVAATYNIYKNGVLNSGTTFLFSFLIILLTYVQIGKTIHGRVLLISRKQLWCIPVILTP